LFNSCTAQTDTENSITYNAVTRGSSITILATSNKIIYTDNEISKTIKLSEKQWEEINILVSKIDLDAISNLDAPSNESATDRALIASLTITKNDTEYHSSYFDHGNPPNELVDLINLLFKIIH
jgi:hypothetical protein